MSVAFALPPTPPRRLPYQEQRWTRPQREVLASTLLLAVWLGANGIGKSLLMAEYARQGLCGELPGQPRRKSYTVILCGESWAQLGSTIGYLWYLTGGEEGGWWSGKLHYKEGELKGKKLQVYELVGGPGKGSTLRCGTYSAGARRLAGPRADLVIGDEPPGHKIHEELWARLLGRGGRALYGFTATSDTYTDVEYLWEIVDDETKPWAGLLQTELTVDAVWPQGGMVNIPWMTAHEIRRFEEGLPGPVRDMRMGRSRTMLSGDRYFTAWGPHLMPLASMGTAPAGLRLGIGIDHGSRPGAERAVLVVVEPFGLRSRVWVLDEYYSDARTESAQDAQGILEMLKRNGYELRDVDVWVGDRAHGGDKWGGYKSNGRLMRLFAEHLGIDVKRRGWSRHLPVGSAGPGLRGFKQPYKPGGSVDHGCEVLHRLMVDSRISVAPRCTHLDEDLREWKGSRIDPHKDGIDALRYIVVELTQEKR